MSDVASFRRLALALDSAHEADHHGRPSFRVGDKIFATLWPADGRAVLNLAEDRQALLLETQPDVFQPARRGTVNWTFVELAQIDEEQLAALVLEAWRRVSGKPKKSRRRGPAAAGPASGEHS